MLLKRRSARSAAAQSCLLLGVWLAAGTQLVRAAQPGVEAGPDCADATSSVGRWRPIPPGLLPGNAATGSLPTLLNASYLELGSPSAWVPCSEEEMEVSLAGCAEVDAQGLVTGLELWANLSCTGHGRDTLGLLATVRLGPGPDPDSAPVATEVDVEVLFADVQLSPAGPGAPPPGAAPPPQPRTEPLPPGPPWMRGPQSEGKGQWREFSAHQQAALARLVAEANATAQRYDYMQYGDSITFLMGVPDALPQWRSLFPPEQGWGPTAPMGVAGNELADVMWRLAVGGELPALAPRMLGLLAGINDLSAHHSVGEAAGHLAFPLAWLRAVLPHDSTVLLLALLPNAESDVAPFNKAYAAVARQAGVPFLRCAQGIDPTDPRILSDGTHPTLEGQRALMECVAPAVRALLRGGG